GTPDHRFTMLEAGDDEGVPPATFDATTAATLSPGRSLHAYKFDGTAGQILYLDNLLAASGVTADLYSPDNSHLGGAGLSGVTGDGEWTLPDTGTYLLVIDGESNSASVGYSFELDLTTVATSPLTLGAEVGGTLSEPGEQHLFTFHATVGQRLYFDGLDDDTESISAQLIDPAGFSRFTERVDTDSALVTLLRTGPYTLRIDGTGIATGDYRFRLLDADAQP